jgi:hypothetical protein
MSHRQLRKSYLGVLNCDSGSVSFLDTPFSDLSNVVSIRMTVRVPSIWVFFVSCMYRGVLFVGGCDDLFYGMIVNWRWLLLYRRCLCKCSVVNCKGFQDVVSSFLVMHLWFSSASTDSCRALGLKLPSHGSPLDQVQWPTQCMTFSLP